ncbi:MAG: PTS sugar transporter subunit IIA [Planctomycetes bacterium]|nr:PTS sugar transporter subunit IIA [Planctomycetota bacterium]
MNFADYICFEASVPNMEVSDRDDAISTLVQALDKEGKLRPGTCDEIIASVIERENEASTGMGRGVAVPHVKHAGAKDIVGSVGQIPAGVDFAALDKQPVFAVILLISPTDAPDKHLQAMENVFKHLQEEKFRRFLRQTNSKEAIEDLLREADDNPSW